MVYHHILGATDFSELGDRALARAVELACMVDARLTLIHVLPELTAPSPLLPHYYDVNVDAARLAEAKTAAAAVLTERAEASLSDRQIEIAYDVRTGDPATEILGCDAELRPDLIVIATHGRRGLSRFIMGSVAERVMAQAKADVLAVRAPARAG